MKAENTGKHFKNIYPNLTVRDVQQIYLGLCNCSKALTLMEDLITGGTWQCNLKVKNDS